LLEKSKLAQHAYEGGHKICLNEVKVLHIEPNTTRSKYKESTYMSLIDHPISQLRLDISPTWTPIITAEELQLHPSWIEWKIFIFIVLVPYGEFCLSTDDFYLNNSVVQSLIRVKF
jgi:hypothetical protein